MTRDLAALWEHKFDEGMAAYHEGQFDHSEDSFRDALIISNRLVQQYPVVDAFLAYAQSCAWLGDTLVNLGANPEAEPMFRQSVDVLRELADVGPAYEELFAFNLLKLAKVYRGIEEYVDFNGPAMTDVQSMCLYRWKRMEAGTWRSPVVGFVSAEWQMKAEAPLLELISLLRRLVHSGGYTFESILALALNLLGETYIRGDRKSEAVAPLRESAEMYRSLVRKNPSRFQYLLDDTHQLLSQVEGTNQSQGLDTAAVGRANLEEEPMSFEAASEPPETQRGPGEPDRHRPAPSVEEETKGGGFLEAAVFLLAPAVLLLIVLAVFWLFAEIGQTPGAQQDTPFYATTPQEGFVGTWTAIKLRMDSATFVGDDLAELKDSGGPITAALTGSGDFELDILSKELAGVWYEKETGEATADLKDGTYLDLHLGPEVLTIEGESFYVRLVRQR